MVEDQVGQGRDCLDLQLVRSLAVGVDAQVRVLQETSQRADQRRVVRRSFDVFEVELRVPAVGAPEEGKHGVPRVLQIAGQRVDLGIGLGRFVVARHLGPRRQHFLGRHGREQLVEDLSDLALVTSEEGLDQLVELRTVHGLASRRKRSLKEHASSW